MDISTFLSALIGGMCTLVGAFGALYWTNLLDRKKAAKTKYIEKIEEIGAYMPQLYRWYKEEAAMYWDEVEREYIYNPRSNKYDCPLYEIINLVNWWIPSLREQVKEISNVVSSFEDLRGYEEASYYSVGGADMTRLASGLQKSEKAFKDNYDYIWATIGTEAKKAVPSR